MEEAMRRIAILIPTLAVAMLINAVPSFSDEGYKTMGGEEATGQKDECLLVARNCPDSVDSIQQRIDKLQREVNKGTGVYTNDELRILNRKLEDANKLLETMIVGG
jgi:hypothetical protein